jgi:hypothetical protein
VQARRVGRALAAIQRFNPANGRGPIELMLPLSRLGGAATRGNREQRLSGTPCAAESSVAQLCCGSVNNQFEKLIFFIKPLPRRLT